MWSFQETVRLTPAQLYEKVRASIGFRVLRSISTRQKEAFRNVPPERYIRKYSKHPLPGIHCYSLCGAKSVLDQTLSLLSFLRYAGIPEAWTVVSDGSLTPEMEKTLTGLHPIVCIAPWTDFLTAQNREACTKLARKHALGMKLALVTAMPADPVSVYIDSDILFFQGASQLREILKNPNDNYYAEEWARAFPAGLLSAEEEKLPPVNSGFLIYARPIDWTSPLARLRELLQAHPEPQETLPIYELTEQTIVQIGYHSSDAKVLDPNKYIINKADSWTPRDHFDHPDRVMRHYLSYLRPKMWAEARHYYR